MDYKKIITKEFSNQDLMLELRYKASKRLFVITSFLFFCNFFFVGARFFDEIFTQTLAISYYIFLICSSFYIYFFSKYSFTLSPQKSKMVLGGIGILFLIFSIPFLGINF